MRKKNFIYLLIIILIATCSCLYNKYMSKSTDSPCNLEIGKRDFIGFPPKENEYKIYPLTKEFTNSLPKNRIDENKEKNTKQKTTEKAPVTKESSVINVLLLGKAVEVPTANTILRLGDSGDKVKYIQLRLKEYGYKIDADGFFNALTYDAILNFQYRCGLDIEGQWVQKL